jgi:hypothetical protein
MLNRGTKFCRSTIFITFICGFSRMFLMDQTSLSMENSRSRMRTTRGAPQSWDLAGGLRSSLRKDVVCFEISQTTQDFDRYLVRGKRRTNDEIWNARGPTEQVHCSLYHENTGSSGWRSVTCSCEHDNEHSGSMKGTTFLDRRKRLRISQENSTPCSWLD